MLVTFFEQTTCVKTGPKPTIMTKMKAGNENLAIGLMLVSAFSAAVACFCILNLLTGKKMPEAVTMRLTVSACMLVGTTVCFAIAAIITALPKPVEEQEKKVGSDGPVK